MAPGGLSNLCWTCPSVISTRGNVQWWGPLQCEYSARLPAQSSSSHSGHCVERRLDIRWWSLLQTLHFHSSDPLLSARTNFPPPSTHCPLSFLVYPCQGSILYRSKQEEERVREGREGRKERERKKSKFSPLQRYGCRKLKRQNLVNDSPVY